MERSPGLGHGSVNHQKELSKIPSQAEESVKKIPGGKSLIEGVDNTVKPVLGKHRSMTARPLSFAPVKVGRATDRIGQLKTLHPTLSERYQPQIKDRVTNERLVAAKVASSKGEGHPQGDPYVILWRGCTEEQLLAIVRAGSGGGAMINIDAERPSEEMAKGQVGENEKLPEFTTNPRVAEGFSKGNFLISVKIDAKYLTQGSPAESGWVTDPSAPVELLGWKEGAVLIPSHIQPHNLSNQGRGKRSKAIVDLSLTARFSQKREDAFHNKENLIPPLPTTDPLEALQPPPLPSSPVPLLTPRSRRLPKQPEAEDKK